jgi:hypothetical protein
MFYLLGRRIQKAQSVSVADSGKQSESGAYLCLTSSTAVGVDPNVLSHDRPSLVEAHVLHKLQVKLVQSTTIET